MYCISSCKSSCPLSRVKRCLLFGGSDYISYIERSAGAKARCPLDRGGVSVIRGSTIVSRLKSAMQVYYVKRSNVGDPLPFESVRVLFC